MVSRERRGGSGGEWGVPSRSHQSRNGQSTPAFSSPGGLRKGEDVSVVPRRCKHRNDRALRESEAHSEARDAERPRAFGGNVLLSPSLLEPSPRRRRLPHNHCSVSTPPLRSSLTHPCPFRLFLLERHLHANPALPYVVRNAHTPVCTHATSSLQAYQCTPSCVFCLPARSLLLECSVHHRYRTCRSATSHPRQTGSNCLTLGLPSRRSPSRSRHMSTGRSSCPILGLPSRSKTNGPRRTNLTSSW